MKFFRFLFPKVEMSLNSFKDYLLTINVFSGMLICFVIGIFELIIMTIWALTHINKMPSTVSLCYFISYLSLFTLSVIGYLYLRLIKDKIETHKFGIKFLLYTYATFIVLWGILISSLDLYGKGNFYDMTFLICYMGVMCGIVIDRKYSYFISLVSFAIVLPLFSYLIYGRVRITFGLTFNLINVVIVCLVISYVNYNQRQRYFNLLVAKNNENIELKEEKENLAYIALNDELTGLKNRFAFNGDREEFALENADSNDYVLVCLIDVDDFKKINDKYGHLFGDDCLRAIGKLLNSWSKYSYRYGGEEFICALKIDSLERVDKLLSELVNEASFVKVKDAPEFKFSISIGAYVSKINNMCSSKECFEILDKNLYQVKKAGKNNYKYTIGN